MATRVAVRAMGLAVLAGAALGASAKAQCVGQWLPGGGIPGISGTVNASVMWDPDGAGPQAPVLVVGGSFSLADSTVVNNIAYWDGLSWHAMGSGLGSTGTATSPGVAALAVYNGDLIAGGAFTSSGATVLGSIARWTGTAWAPLAAGATKDFGANGVNALVVANGELIAGGGFTTAALVPSGTVTVNRLARWNGTAWAAVNPSGATKGVNGAVNALALTPSGQLVAGGSFTTAGTATTGSLTVNRMARYTWNGTNWVAAQMGSGVGGTVMSLAVKSNGDVIAGGGFTAAPATVAGQPATPSTNYVIRWDNASSTWNAMDMGVGTDGTNDANVRALAVLANGDVVAGGEFWTANGVYVGELARWNGSAWSAMWTSADPRVVKTLLVRPDGTLVVGGSFASASGVGADGVASWNGANWSAISAQPQATSGAVTGLQRIGNDVYAGGKFVALEGQGARRVAKLSGTAAMGKTGLGSGLFEYAEPFPSVVVNADPPMCFTAATNGDIVCGSIDMATSSGGARTLMARWNGSAWSGFAGASGLVAGDLYGAPFTPVGVVKATTTMANGDILAGGLFFFPDDPFTFHFLGRWDGTAWTDLGIALGSVEKIIVKADGHVIIAGNFINAGGDTHASNIAEWDGVTTYGDGTPVWTGLGFGADGSVLSIALAPNGDLIAGGEFTAVGNLAAGDLTVNRVARWNGTAWSRLGSGMSDAVLAVAAMPGGDVVAGGAFTSGVTIAGEPATPAVNRLARWNGTSWSGFGTGLGSAGTLSFVNNPAGTVFTLAVAADGVLLVGGDFATANGSPSAFLARWADCVGSCCQSDGSCTLAAGSPSATCASGTLTVGGSCSPNVCPTGATGVCCRGATCNATVPSGSCTGAGSIGAVFVTTATVCNGGGIATTPCCYSDFNKSGALEVQDIFDFLNAWFAGSPYAKVGGDGVSGTLAVADIFDFLNAWFAGGC